METVEVVIKIPKEQLERLQRITNGTWGLMNLNSEEIAILNGTVLPKGHGRIGDLDELHYIFKEMCNSYNINNLSFMSDMDMNFDLAPTIIEADKEGEDKE